MSPPAVDPASHRSALASLFWLVLAVVPTMAFAAEPPRPLFADVTAASGIDHIQHVAQVPPDCLFLAGAFCEPERMSGAAAVGDIDGDGDADLLVTRLDAHDILYRNDGSGRFMDVSVEAGLAAYSLQSNAALFADVDADGDADLLIAVLGEAGDSVNDRNFLFVNDGSGIFTEEAVLRGVAVQSGGPRRMFSIAAGDYDRDGFVDLHFGEWLPFVASHSRLLRNRGAVSPGTFDDVTSSAGVGLQDSDVFAATFSDLDWDGWPDLAVAGDFGSSRLFWNAGGASFLDGTSAAGVGSDENGMGSTFGDYDADGDLDWFVTSIFDADATCDDQPCNWGNTGNRLYRNDGDRLFSDATDEAGVRDGAWGWGAVFFDYDNDADLDLVMTNGVDFPAGSFDDAFNHDAMRLWENDGSGSMIEISAQVGLEDTASGKGLLVFDPDQDGDLDLFVVNNAGQPRLFENRGGNAQSWLRVETRGIDSNSEGLGTRVWVWGGFGLPRQLREIGTSSHFLGQSERTAHFGLGPYEGRVPLVLLHWPSGRFQAFFSVARNSTLVAVEPPARCGLIGLELMLPWLLLRGGRRACGTATRLTFMTPAA